MTIRHFKNSNLSKILNIPNEETCKISYTFFYPRILSTSSRHKSKIHFEWNPSSNLHKKTVDEKIRSNTKIMTLVKIVHYVSM